MSEARGSVGARREPIPWGFVAALLFAALNLRAPFVSVAPVTNEIQRGLGVGAAGVGLLTTVPVFCFGVAAPLALLVIRRAGPELSLAVCLSAVVVGGVLRSAGPYGLTLAATVVIGLGITVGNIVIPVLIRRDVPPGRAGVVTGLYTSVFNVGSMLATVLTAPLAALLGWRLALGAGLVVAVPSLLVWLRFLRRRVATERPVPSTPVVTTPVWRNPTVWLLSLAFAAQAGSYYAVTAWLPTLLADELGLGPEAAGLAASIFQIFAVAGALGLPLLSLRFPTWVVTVGVGVLWIACPVLLLVDPGTFVLACVLGGVAQGGGITAVFTSVVRISRTDRESAQMSAFVQGTGYVVGAGVPSVVGLVHDRAGGWSLPLLVVVTTTTVFLLASTTAALRGRVRST